MLFDDGSGEGHAEEKKESKKKVDDDDDMMKGPTEKDEYHFLLLRNIKGKKVEQLGRK